MYRPELTHRAAIYKVTYHATYLGKNTNQKDHTWAELEMRLRELALAHLCESFEVSFGWGRRSLEICFELESDAEAFCQDANHLAQELHAKIGSRPMHLCVTPLEPEFIDHGDLIASIKSIAEEFSLAKVIEVFAEYVDDDVVKEFILDGWAENELDKVTIGGDDSELLAWHELVVKASRKNDQ